MKKKQVNKRIEKFHSKPLRSMCCNAEVSQVPAYYTTTMKTSEGKEIPKVYLCSKCGYECEAH